MSHPPTPQSDLDQEEQRARVQKLVTETALAALQLSAHHQRYERMKAITGIGGLIAGLAAVLGLFLSAYEWRQAEESTRRLRVGERLDRSLALLGGEKAATRLAAAVSLSSFLRQDTEHASQALQALTNALAIEESITVRNAIVATIQRVDPANVSNIDLNRALESLVLVSRGLVDEGDLWTSHRASVYGSPNHDSAESRALSVAAAIAILLHKGARSQDMSRTYLSAVDLSGLDLTGVKLDDSILAWSDFSRANLDHASCKDADLESANFTNSRLTNADFSVSPDPLTTKRHFTYVTSQMQRNQLGAHQAHAAESFFIWGPDFSCADARGANFSGQPLMPIYANELSGVIHSHIVFNETSLAGAKFLSLRAFGIVKAGQPYDSQPFPTTSSSASWGPNDQYAITEFALNNDGALKNTRDNYTAALVEFGRTFSGSNWREAAFDRSVREALETLNIYPVKHVPPCETSR